MSQSNLLLCALLVIALAATLVIVGCGGGGGASLYFNVSDRASWSAAGPTLDRLAFASFGGNSLLYIYSVDSSGSDLLLLTPSDNDDDYTDEGGSYPAFSPDGSEIAFASRRGSTTRLYTMDAEDGDRAGATAQTPDTGIGFDYQPSWKPDGTGLIYTTTRGTGAHDIYAVTVAAPGNPPNTPTAILSGDYQWPCYNPQDDTMIAVQDGDASLDVDTDIAIYNTAGVFQNKIADSSFSDGGPAWYNNGTGTNLIAFHSDRAGDFDIYVWDIGSATLTQLTSDGRSDGFPVWNSDGTRIAFTRDRELWSVLAADGSDPQRITRRFQ